MFLYPVPSVPYVPYDHEPKCGTTNDEGRMGILLLLPKERAISWLTVAAP
jgi:hypothetical protein